MLENIVVLDLADEQGSFCSKLLADLGASVIKIENPGGDPARNGLDFFYANTNKLDIALDLKSRKGKQEFHWLVKRSDVLVETWSPSFIKSSGLDPDRLAVINSALIQLSITGFGRTGPKCSYRSHDIVASAFGGQMYVTGSASGPPTSLFGRQSYYAASLFGANAVLLALKRRTITGKGCCIDLAIQEAVASMLDPVMTDYFNNGRIAGRGGGAQHDSFIPLRCKDGYIHIPIFRNWETLFELIDSEGKARELLESRWKRRAYQERHAGRAAEAATGWAANHTKKDLFKLGQTMQFPWAPIESPREVFRSPQLKARRFFSRTRVPGRNTKISVPRLPYKFSAFTPPPFQPAPRLGEHAPILMERLKADRDKKTAAHWRNPAEESCTANANLLKGIRIVDLTRMLSGPYATRILADFGAEVIKVQSKLTARGAERNDNPYFLAWNRNKRSICLNLNRPEARDLFLELVSISDVVVENYSPRVLENWGLTYRRLLWAKPGLIMASISAMGQTGPWRNYVGFAQTFHALAGLISASSRASHNPVTISNAYGDMVAGLYASLAILSALKHRDETGEGQYIDLSAYEALCTLLGPAFNASSGLQEDCDPGFHGCYPCAGKDRWCVIAISGEDEWRTFCRIIGASERMPEKYPGTDCTKQTRQNLDRIIARWTIARRADALVHRFQKAGIAAGVVQNAGDLAKDSHLAARRFFASLNHPLLGASISDRSALWSCREKPINWKSAPLLGEANDYVFSTLLGHSKTDIRTFIKKRILY